MKFIVERRDKMTDLNYKTLCEIDKKLLNDEKITENERQVRLSILQQEPQIAAILERTTC